MKNDCNSKEMLQNNPFIRDSCECYINVEDEIKEEDEQINPPISSSSQPE